MSTSFEFHTNDVFFHWDKVIHSVGWMVSIVYIRHLNYSWVEIWVLRPVVGCRGIMLTICSIQSESLRNFNFNFISFFLPPAYSWASCRLVLSSCSYGSADLRLSSFSNPSLTQACCTACINMTSGHSQRQPNQTRLLPKLCHLNNTLHITNICIVCIGDFVLFKGD